ncbi:MAG TPA: family 43 glycosylhydrolase [Pyrinomonadaceae bacterium]|nr:family 43 glycosylhydrolase [Pyrinomonadaceae bacterium]
MVIYNPKVKKWWMFYTNRRANVPNLSGVTWVHGTPIGIAESDDNGASWKYVGDANIKLPESVGSKTPTFWAPDVIRGDDGKFYMFLTVVPGIFEDWQHPRNIVQLVSKDLRKWDYMQTLPLVDKVIDAAVMKMPDGMWRLWYNNEKDKKTTYWAESRDLKTWTDRGKAINNRGEGPKVFRWKGKFWMIYDPWKGLGVYRSDDATNWEAQSYNLLDTPGKGLDDQVIGGHPDVVVSGERAFLFYFTHPGRRGDDAKKDTTEQRRSSIQVVELKLKDGWLTCDRDEPTHIQLTSVVNR